MDSRAKKISESGLRNVIEKLMAELKNRENDAEDRPWKAAFELMNQLVLLIFKSNAKDKPMKSISG